MAVSSCASTQSSDDAATVGGGAVVGSLIGAVVGAAIGGRRGAGVGAAIGAIGGGLAGIAVLRTKQDYANEAAMIEGETQIVRQQRTELEEFNDTLRSEIASLREEAKVARSSRSAAIAYNKKSAKLRDTAAENLKSVELEIATTEKLLETDPPGDLSTWRTELASLKAERDDLKAILDGFEAGEVPID
jgi:outer membrane lipoprotein SlyB